MKSSGILTQSPNAIINKWYLSFVLPRAWGHRPVILIVLFWNIFMLFLLIPKQTTMGRNKSLNLYAGHCLICKCYVESEKGYRVICPKTHVDKRIAGKGWHTECKKCRDERMEKLRKLSE